jgi:hypothetical protein
MPNRGTRSFALRLVAEFLVIVVGVLVALGVDSWAASQRERTLEAEYLSRLLDDVRYDLRELSLVDSVSRIAGAASRMLHTPSVVDTLGPSRLVSAVLVVGNVRIPDPSRSTFDELINSGQIVLIRSEEVRRALASYDRTINELSGGWNAFDPDLRPWHAARIPLEIDRRRETGICGRGSSDEIDSFPIVCEFDLGGWSTDGLRAEIRTEAGQRLFRTAEHNYQAHAFFTSLLLEEARALERVLEDAVSALTGAL